MAACLLPVTLSGFVYVQETDIFQTLFYVYGIYRCTFTPHDIKVYLCLHMGQTEDSWSLNVLAP